VAAGQVEHEPQTPKLIGVAVDVDDPRLDPELGAYAEAMLAVDDRAGRAGARAAAEDRTLLAVLGDRLLERLELLVAERRQLDVAGERHHASGEVLPGELERVGVDAELVGDLG
jgi:hypothetical protein